MTEADENGWIDWNGGEMPVGELDVVQVRFRCTNFETNPRRAGSFWWHHSTHPKGEDIIAYRPATPLPRDRGDSW